MNHINPLVSVIVPCYNHEKYVELCINSIIQQTFSDFELIVIDDGSKDSSIEILKNLQEKYGFRLVIQENMGLSATLNKGLQEFAKGKYMTFCASDDYWTLNKLELQVNFMESNPEIPMCYGKAHYIDEDSKILEKYDSQNEVLKGGYIFDDIFTFKLHPPVNYLFKRTIFFEIGFYDSTIYAEDYYMNLQIASKFQIGFINDYLFYYRVDRSAGKVIRFDKVSKSHLMSIEGYKNYPNYKLAKTTVYLNRFALFAPYKKHKLIALISGLKSIRFLFNKSFIIASIKLLLFWK